MQIPPATSAPRKVTMLFAVVATGAAASAAILDAEPASPLTTVAEAKRPVALEEEPQRIIHFDRPLVLRNGAPACGNTMSKAMTPRERACRLRRFEPDPRLDGATEATAAKREALRRPK